MKYFSTTVNISDRTFPILVQAVDSGAAAKSVLSFIRACMDSKKCYPRDSVEGLLQEFKRDGGTSVGIPEPKEIVETSQKGVYLV